MKFNFVKNWKIVLISVLALLLVGMAMLSFLGVNNTKDYDKVNQLKVSVSLDLNGASDKAKQTTESYLEDKGIDTYSFGTQTLNDGRVVVYKVKVNDVNVEELKTAIVTAINNDKVNVQVSLSEITSYSENQGLGVVGAIAITAVALFLVIFFVEKWKSALTVVSTSVLSALVFFALMNVVRIPAVSLLGISLGVAFLMGAVLSSVLVVRYKELMKNPSNSGMSFSDIANQGVVSSLLRICFVCFSLIVLGAMFAGILGGYSVFLGLQIVLASLVAGACTVFASPILWVIFNDKKLLTE